MKVVLKKIIRNMKSSLMMMAVIFVLASLLFVSFMLYSANDQFDKLAQKETGLYFMVSGDINKNIILNDTKLSLDQYDESLAAYEDTFLKISKYEGISTSFLENFSVSSLITSCNDYFDKDNYRCLYLPYIPQDYPNYDSDQQSDTRFYGISQDFENNEQYNSLVDEDQSGSIYSVSPRPGIIPTIIGVNQEEFSDLALNNFRIVKGSTFKKEDLNSLAFKVIVPSYAMIIDRNGIKSDIEIGDKINLKVNNSDQIYEFEVIGLHDGITSIDYHNEQIKYNSFNGIYIPSDTFKLIQEDLIKTWKNNFQDSSNYYYSILGGYRPMMFQIENKDKMNKILDDISFLIKDLGKYGDYTYISSLDQFVDAYVLIETNKISYFVLNIILCFLVLGTLFLLNIINISYRKKEMGILNSLGKKKYLISLELWLEFIFLSIIPILGAIIFSYFFTHYIVDKQFSYEIMKIISGEYNPYFFDASGTGTLTKKFNLVFGFKEYFILVMIWISIISLSSLFSYLKISKLDPKNILLMGEEE